MRAEALQAEYATMAPEERAAFDRLSVEAAPDNDFLTEVITRLLDGSMQEAEAEQWLNSAEEEFERRREG